MSLRAAGSTLTITLALLLLAPAPARSTGTEVEIGQATWVAIRVTPGDVLGIIQPGGIFVSARETEPGVVAVSLDLGNGSVFEATVDRVRNTATIRLRDDQGLPRPVTSADIERLASAYRTLSARAEIVAQPAAAPMLRLLDWVGDAPIGGVLDLDVQLRKIKSLCKKIDKRVVARWDYIGGTAARKFKVGPCAQGACLGRCGQGCGGIPGPEYAVQQFTRDCLDHDACVGALGYASPSCQDEFAATADDALSAPDCNAIEGTWRLNYKTKPDATNRVMDFSMTGGRFAGSFDVAQGRSVTFEGTRDNPPPLLKDATLKLPLWMSSACNSTPLGFAEATIKGTNYCGTIIARLKKGTWNRYRNCRPDGTEPWTGRIKVKRTKW